MRTRIRREAWTTRHAPGRPPALGLAGPGEAVSVGRCREMSRRPRSRGAPGCGVCRGVSPCVARSLRKIGALSPRFRDYHGWFRLGDDLAHTPEAPHAHTNRLANETS